MTDWPRIQTDVDDDRPAREDEVDYCAHCGEPVLEGALQRHAGERRCEDCRPLCLVCHDEPVSDSGEFCETCALAAMGVEV
jgi:CRISPR/Cas system-associated protein Cas10 (large subunit of type III CRISPR-Cas system)